MNQLLRSAEKLRPAEPLSEVLQFRASKTDVKELNEMVAWFNAHGIKATAASVIRLAVQNQTRAFQAERDEASEKLT